MRPRVSVVIPTYNGARYLGQTLKAVFAQRFCDFEVLIVDDGSTDNTLAVAHSKEFDLQVFTGPKKGVSAARNLGAQHAQGEFLCFLDQDDIWFPEHLWRQMQVLDQHAQFSVAVNPYLHWYPDHDSYPEPAQLLGPAPEQDLDPDFSGWVYHQFMQDCWALTSATTLRREAWDRYGGFSPEQSYGEDWELWLRLSREVQFAKLPWPPVLYRQHATQGSRVVRPVDHRVELLLKTQSAHGLSSRDGRALPLKQFAGIIAKYEMEFGWHHYQFGDRKTAARALFRAWRRAPSRAGYLARGLAALIRSRLPG